MAIISTGPRTVEFFARNRPCEISALIREIKIRITSKVFPITPQDGIFVCGEFLHWVDFSAATGCAGAGIAMSGGIGRLVLNWNGS